jgi:hypothetical protein
MPWALVSSLEPSLRYLPPTQPPLVRDENHGPSFGENDVVPLCLAALFRTARALGEWYGLWWKPVAALDVR